MSRKHPNRGNLVKNNSAELRFQAMTRSFSGPLPPPEALERYNQIIPGTAERIIAMAEGQHSHRLHLERHVIESNVSAQTRGTILGFVVAMTAIVGGIWLIHDGKNTAGLASVLSSLAALVGVFLYSKHEQKKDLEEKTRQLNAATR